MEGKERKRADDFPAGAVEQVRELLNRPRSSADFSPAARYAVQRLADYAEQEHELRGKAEERCVKMNGQVTDARLMVEAQARTVDDLRQQLSFLRQAMQDLSERERRILALRFYDGRTQMEVAGSLGISQAQVSRLEKGALASIRKAIRVS